jgi:dipeptide/tripeptide permease
MTPDTENSVADSAPPGPVKTSHPIGFWFFFWGEFSERASFYGMRTILALYLTSVIGLAVKDAGPIQYRFKAAVYFLPLLGGFIADRFFGKYWTIVGFSIPYVLGHFILGIPHLTAVYFALALLAGGSGVIKPNISTLMGQTYDQQRPGQAKLLSSAFLWFYFSINIGSLISTFALPYLRDRWAGPNPTHDQLQHAYAIAFQFPAWLMVAALGFFAAGKPFYAKETRSRRAATPEEKKERWATLGKLGGVFALITFFWVPYEHNDTIWVWFIRDYVNLPQLHIPFLNTGAQKIAPDQVQSLNPLFVLIFAPLCVWLFKKLDPNNRVFTASNRMLLGFGMGVVSALLMWGASSLAGGSPTSPPGYVVPDAEKISVFWPVAAYITLTLGEVLVYGTGLELSYTAAPQSMKGFITGCFLATIMLADLINDRMSQLYGGSLTDPLEDRGRLSPAWFFGIMTLIAIGAMVGFFFVGRRLGRQTAAESAHSPE